ncbi:hypothetical protein WOB59_11975 [Methylocystis sp. IM4]|uniref:hypothetical protein n=1 Tax=Methylocystis sp. IM4 TaxID=3136560 RepID=UPI003119CCDE
MAAKAESDTGGALFERILFGFVFAAVAALEASGGPEHILVAGFFAGAALYLLRPSSEGGRQSVNFAVDFLAVGAFAALCDRSWILWRAPETMDQLFRFSPVGAGTATLLYVFGVLVLTARSRLPLRIALFLMPFLFSLLVALGSPPITQIGAALFLGFEVPVFVAQIVGRTLVLFLLNEAIVIGVPLALGRFLPRQWRPHGMLFFSAFAATLTPFVASAVPVFVTPYLPGPVAAVVAALLAAVAQAGLWGQTYLVTQAIAGLFRATPRSPSWSITTGSRAPRRGPSMASSSWRWCWRSASWSPRPGPCRSLRSRRRSARPSSGRSPIRWRAASSRARTRRRLSADASRKPMCAPRIMRAARSRASRSPSR